MESAWGSWIIAYSAGVLNGRLIFLPDRIRVILKWETLVQVPLGLCTIARITHPTPILLILLRGACLDGIELRAVDTPLRLLSMI